jgi:hypothetical protein
MIRKTNAKVMILSTLGPAYPSYPYYACPWHCGAQVLPETLESINKTLSIARNSEIGSMRHSVMAESLKSIDVALGTTGNSEINQYGAQIMPETLKSNNKTLSTARNSEIKQ